MAHNDFGVRCVSLAVKKLGIVLIYGDYLMQDQVPAQLQGMTTGNADMPLHDRSLSNSTIATDDDPIRGDLSHGILPSHGALDAGQQYFDPAQLPQQSLVNDESRPR